MGRIYRAGSEFSQHTLKPKKSELTSPEFDEFTRQFYQDLLEDVTTNEEVIGFTISPFIDSEKRARLREYLDSITKEDISDEDLRKLWWSSFADIVFYDGAELRAFLKRVRDRL